MGLRNPTHSLNFKGIGWFSQGNWLVFPGGKGRFSQEATQDFHEISLNQIGKGRFSKAIFTKKVVFPRLFSRKRALDPGAPYKMTALPARIVTTFL